MISMPHPDSFKKQTKPMALLIIGLVLFSFVTFLLTSRTVSAAPPPGFSEVIQVHFNEGTDVDPPTDALSPALAALVDSMVPLFTLPTSQLNELRTAGEDLPDLTLWFKITVTSGTDVNTFLDDLRLLSSVNKVELVPLPSELPAVTPDFTGNQGYLGPAPDGIDATFSATIPGGNGSGITVYDVEYSWNQNHEDLSKAAGVTLLLNPGDTAVDPFGSNHHGTAVLGELVADNDTKGVTGISWGGDVGMAPANTANLGYNPANAILLAVADASPGDVILIEQQTGVCNLGLPCNGPGGDCGPLEWISSVFDAIQTAVANRITVVEAAGNGGVDLDQAACGTTFDRTVRDSGAIIVGAGGPTTASGWCTGASPCDRERLSFSSYGSRVDLQGWGDGVATTGYGTSYTNVDDPTNPNFFYRFTFGGTSSASPIVAGAVANLQGIAINQFGTPLIPFQIRSLLQQTGSPQLGNTTENIGPRPDLQGAIASINQGAVDLFMLVDLSGSFIDDLPLFQAQTPGIITNLQNANPNVKFGLAKYEDYPISPFGVTDPLRDDTAYTRLVDLSFVDTANPGTDPVLSTIAGLPLPIAGDGGDGPQSQLPALFQAATGTGQDLTGEGYPLASIPPNQQANFRIGATKLFLLWTDAPFHLQGDPGDIPYPGPTFVETVEAIEALDPPMVIGISSGPDGVDDLKDIAAATGALAPEGGVDCNNDGTIDILEGEPLVCEIAATGEGIGDAVTTVVKAAVAAATPVARCTDKDVPTDPGVCGATVSVDDGSYDPDGGPVTLFQSPAGPYPVGTSAVTLKVTDETGLSDFCVASVTVTDDQPPVPVCNAAATIVPPDAPISLTAMVSDNCKATVQVTDYDCFKFTKKGKRVDKTGSCDVSIAGDTVTILQSGGVGTHITWDLAANDENGNTAVTQCEVIVANPGQGN